jgi:hypothetical protein
MLNTNIDHYDPSTLVFVSNYEEYESIRHPEDGEMLYAKHFFIRAEAPNGMRWIRTVGVVEWELDSSIDEDRFEVFVRQTANADTIINKSEKVCERLNNATTPKLNPKVWEFAGACYGSEAYQMLNLEEEICTWERKSDDAYYAR